MADMNLSPPGYDAQSLAQARGLNMPRLGKGAGPELDKTARDFEAVFLSSMFSQMWSGLEVDPTFGGGHAEEMWRGMMVEEYGKMVASSGGVGIAQQMKAQLLRMQEVAGGPA